MLSLGPNYQELDTIAISRVERVIGTSGQEEDLLRVVLSRFGMDQSHCWNVLWINDLLA